MGAAEDIRTEVVNLQRVWQPRSAAFREWYNLIRQHNNLHQPGMESVISPDPRASYNMARWLLTPRPGSFVVDTEGMTEGQATSVGVIERYVDRQLALNVRRTRGGINRPVMSRVIDLMLATGWIAIGSAPTPDGWVIEAFNPAQLYPEYGAQGQLLRVGRMYQSSGPEINAMIARNGWSTPKHRLDRRQWWIHSLWKMTEFGPVHGVVVGNNHVAKPMTLEPHFSRIPMYVVPVGGLPDDGSISGTNNWRGEVGQSFLAPLLDIQNNYNKMLTYMQQLLRDTANPRWVERVRGESVVDPDRLWERGAVFTMEPEEDLFPIPTPPLPPELRGHEFEIRNMIQRVSFSDASMGNITTQINGFLLNQVTAQAKQSLSPFFDGVREVVGDMATTNIAIMRALGMPLGREGFPSLPDQVFLDFKYDVRVPGDFLQRVSAARTANPEFRLSKSLLMDELFPEVSSVQRELSRIQTEDALENPVFKQLLVVRELARASQEARKNNDVEFAQLLDRAADLIESQFGGSGPDTSAGPPGLRPEALPPDVQRVLSGESNG